MPDEVTGDETTAFSVITVSPGALFNALTFFATAVSEYADSAVVSTSSSVLSVWTSLDVSVGSVPGSEGQPVYMAIRKSIIKKLKRTLRILNLLYYYILILSKNDLQWRIYRHFPVCMKNCFSQYWVYNIWYGREFKTGR
jgi:hypothetical protein